MAVATLDKKEQFLSQFRVDEGLVGISKKAAESLNELDFPTTREEYWKYTRLAKIQNGSFSILESDESVQARSVNEEALHIECVNGFFRSPVGEIQAGVSIEPIQEIKNCITDYHYEFFSALNTAYYTSGIRIKIAEGVQVNKSIQVNFLTTEDGLQAQPRIEVVAEKNSESNLIFNWQNDGHKNNFWNVVSEMNVKANASLNVHQLQEGGDDSYLINTTNVIQKRDSRFGIFTVCLEGKILRNNLNIEVDGQNCETRLNGVYLAQGKQHIDNHTYVDHKKPNCFSSENYKGVLNDDATAVFNGKVMVQPDAQKINAFQNNQNILLSDGATINSKPELEIYADDVKCSHGSTTGQLNEEAMFYLQSRGVTEKSAKKMLVRAFVFDVLEEIKLESFREYVGELVEEKYRL
jgi:Fe-S cluster assembly protein SufD